jgi:hypothetical protein
MGLSNDTCPGLNGAKAESRDTYQRDLLLFPQVAKLF